MTDEMRTTYKEALHEHLAKATELTWKLQNALTESPLPSAPLLTELARYAEELVYRSRIIEGEIAHWALLESRFTE